MKDLEDLNDVLWCISQVSVTAREDVPPFGPVIPDPPLFTDVRHFIFTVLFYYFLKFGVSGTDVHTGWLIICWIRLSSYF